MIRSPMLVIGIVCLAHTTSAQPTPAITKGPNGDSITIRIINSEIRAAVQTIGQFLDKPVVFVAGPTMPSITLETPRPIPKADAERVLRGLLESNGFELVDDTTSHIFKARPREVKAQPTVLTPADNARRQAGAPELFVIELHHARSLDV